MIFVQISTLCRVFHRRLACEGGGGGFYNRLLISLLFSANFVGGHGFDGGEQSRDGGILQSLPLVKTLLCRLFLPAGLKGLNLPDHRSRAYIMPLCILEKFKI